MTKRLLFSLLLVSCAVPARAQVYAPETDCHDPSQRTFPVEAARVLAWHRAAAGQPAIAEVTFEVATTPDRETTWKLRWLDAGKTAVREKEVRYAETLLTSGPDFYREVFTQLTGDDWKISATSPDNAATAFWQGAELSGVTRLDGVKAAGTLLSEKPRMARAADASRMAGILSHAALPMLHRQTSLDPVLLARAAAWLCIAEAKSREKFTPAWVPILFLSGRENSAGALATEAPWRPADKQGAAERFWRKTASREPVKDTFLFAGQGNLKAFALPLMTYSASLDPRWRDLIDPVADDLMGREMVERMTEYLTGSDPGRPMVNYLARWEQAVAGFQPSERDFAGHRKLTVPPAGVDEKPLAALQRLSPLINLGLDEGSGALIPVAHITTRDLLGLGWEMGGLLGADYQKSLNESGAERAAAQTAFASIKGSNAFLTDRGIQDIGVRAQHLGSPNVQRSLAKTPPAAWTSSPDVFLRRQWLNRSAALPGVVQLIDAKAPDTLIQSTVERLIHESGPSIISALATTEIPTLTAAIDRLNLRAAITQEIAARPLGDPMGADEVKKAMSSAKPAEQAEIEKEVDFSKFKTADEFWAALETLREIPRRHANSPEDRMRQIRAWLVSRRSGAESFLKAYPNDARRHSARLMSIDSTLQLERFGEQAVAKIDGNELEAIINANDADEPTRGEAEFFKLMVDSREVSFDSRHTVPPFQQALAAYLEKYPKHERAPYVGSMLLQTLSQLETPSTEPLLKKLSKNSNEQIALQAKAVLQQRQFMLELKKKPLELKFTAIDGTAIDAAKLRGKVLLIDFWASWCGPCMTDAPHVVATYEKLRERGFEIIGISLDQDKAAMESALKSAKMTWPQYFDGKGWQTEFVQRFGVRGIPSTWLFDKKGKLREHDLRGAELEARIENLLKEK